MLQAEYESAEDLCYEQLRDEPDSVFCLTVLGQVAHQRGDIRDAVIMYRKATAVEPELIEPWLLLARALLDRREITAAGSAIASALSLDDQHVEVRKLHADQCLRSDQIALAADVYASLLREQVLDTTVLEGLGNAYRMLGKRDAAIETYQLWANRCPDDGNAWWSLANLKNYAFSDEELQQMQGYLKQSGVTEPQMRFALGQAWESRGSFEVAFQQYDAANRLMERQEPYDSAAHERLIDRLVAFDWATGEAHGTPAVPIFVVGMPRSGTTLIEQILASHSQVVGRGELSVLGDMVADLERAGEDYPELLLNLDEQAIADLGRRFVDGAGIAAGFFVDKMPDNFLLIGLIRLILPGAKIVHAQRHPVATCFSCFKQRFGRGQAYTYNLSNLAHYYQQYQRLMAFWYERYPGSVYTVDYESLVNDPRQQITGLLDFCGLPFEPACLDFHMTDRVINSASSEQVRAPIYQTSLEQWKYFEPFLGLLIERLAGPFQD